VNLNQPLFPHLFKGIALFTPGGDLIYAIDPSKQGHWHLELCAGLQEILGLPEPPHFLVPGYTATIDRWLDPKTRQLRTSAEIYWPVRRHQDLLNAVFNTVNLLWQVAPWEENSCDPMVLETYRDQFPQLWEDHDLIVRCDRSERSSYFYSESYTPTKPLTHPNERYPQNESEEIEVPDQPPGTHSYVLRLFVSGNNESTEHILKSLHQLLEHSLRYPYTLKVIDIFKHPDQAEEYQVSATPTLVRVWPQPVRRIVGDLTDIERILRVLAAPET
jgi:circadian clock protein KaiB